MINRFDPVGSTDDVDFLTRKRTVPTEKSEVTHVTLDGKDGNTWEQLLASELELNRNVTSYVKNDHLGFTIPYVHKGRSHEYVPDFLVRLERRADDDVDAHADRRGLRQPEEPRPDRGRRRPPRATQWCAAVNNHGGFGRWGYVEMTDPLEFKARLADAIQALYGDAPIIGDPDLLDFELAGHGA